MRAPCSEATDSSSARYTRMATACGNSRSRTASFDGSYSKSISERGPAECPSSAAGRSKGSSGATTTRWVMAETNSL